MTISVGLVEPHPATMLGIAAVVNAQVRLQVVAAAPSAADLVQRPVHVDVVLMEIEFEGSEPVRTSVRRLDPLRAPVLAYTAGTRPSLLREAWRAGVVGRVRKADQLGVLIDGVWRAVRGEAFDDPEWAAATTDVPESIPVLLSGREMEVMVLYASGKTAEQVAALLFISVSTVIDHIRKVRRKYATSGRTAPTKTDLLRRAQEDGYLLF